MATLIHLGVQNQSFIHLTNILILLIALPESKYIKQQCFNPPEEQLSIIFQCAGNAIRKSDTAVHLNVSNTDLSLKAKIIFVLNNYFGYYFILLLAYGLATFYAKNLHNPEFVTSFLYF